MSVQPEPNLRSRYNTELNEPLRLFEGHIAQHQHGLFTKIFCCIFCCPFFGCYQLNKLCQYSLCQLDEELLNRIMKEAEETRITPEQIRTLNKIELLKLNFFQLTKCSALASRFKKLKSMTWQLDFAKITNEIQSNLNFILTKDRNMQVVRTYFDKKKEANEHYQLILDANNNIKLVKMFL